MIKRINEDFDEVNTSDIRNELTRCLGRSTNLDMDHIKKYQGTDTGFILYLTNGKSFDITVKENEWL